MSSYFCVDLKLEDGKMINILAVSSSCDLVQYIKDEVYIPYDEYEPVNVDAIGTVKHSLERVANRLKEQNSLLMIMGNKGLLPSTEDESQDAPIDKIMANNKSLEDNYKMMGNLHLLLEIINNAAYGNYEVMWKID